MRRNHHKPEEIVSKLRQPEVLSGQGKSVAEAVRAIVVTEATYYRRRGKYGGLNLHVPLDAGWSVPPQSHRFAGRRMQRLGARRQKYT